MMNAVWSCRLWVKMAMTFVVLGCGGDIGTSAAGGSSGRDGGIGSGGTNADGSTSSGQSGRSGSQGSGGSAGAGGSSGSTAGGSSGAAAGGTGGSNRASGGSSGIAGSSGGASTGGSAAGGAPNPNCPPIEPRHFDPGQRTNYDPCTDVGGVCRYAMDCCSCNHYAACASEAFWWCVPLVAGCPEIPPSVGDPCSMQGQACVYCDQNGAWSQLCNAGKWAGRNLLGCT
jgi:hypothetical protein